MLRQNGLFVFSANADQTLTSNMDYVLYTGNGTGTYNYTLPEIGTAGVYGSKAYPSQCIKIRNAGSAASTLNILKHANDTGVYLGASGAVTTFVLPVGSAVTLMADITGAYWYLVDGMNFFDQWDDLEFLTSARAAVSTSAVLADIGNGVETWKFQPSTNGGSPDKWLMCQRQITHGWDKQPIQFHVHFTPVAALTATGTGIVVTWTVVWRSVQPGPELAWTNESNFTMTWTGGAGVNLATANNYNASVGGNNTATAVTNPSGSTMILARLELTSVTNNGANQTTEIFLNGFDAHMKLRRRGTILPFPEP